MAASNEQIQALILRNQQARMQVMGHVRHLKSRVDIPARIKNNYLNHKPLWMIGAAVAGIALSRMLRSPKVIIKNAGSKSRAGMSGLAISAAMTLLKPVVKNIILTQVKKRLITASTKNKA